jgi:hypothetical protein
VVNVQAAAAAAVASALSKAEQFQIDVASLQQENAAIEEAKRHLEREKAAAEEATRQREAREMALTDDARTRIQNLEQVFSLSAIVSFLVSFFVSFSLFFSLSLSLSLSPPPLFLWLVSINNFELSSILSRVSLFFRMYHPRLLSFWCFRKVSEISLAHGCLQLERSVQMRIFVF